MTNPDPCRFCRIYAFGVLGFAALVGLAHAPGLALSKFAGEKYLMHVVVLSAVRSLAAAASGSALLVALVAWAHPLPLVQMQTELPRVLKRGLLVTLPGYAVAVALMVGLGLLLATLVFHVPWALARPALGTPLPSDWLAGALSALADAGLITFLAWRYLPRLQAGRSSLAMKLVIAWTFGTGLRMTVGLLVSLFLPA